MPSKTFTTGFRSLMYLDKTSLKEFYKSMGFNNTYKILDEYIAVWESKDTIEVCI